MKIMVFTSLACIVLLSGCDSQIKKPYNETNLIGKWKFTESTTENLGVSETVYPLREGLTLKQLGWGEYWSLMSNKACTWELIGPDKDTILIYGMVDEIKNWEITSLSKNKMKITGEQSYWGIKSKTVISMTRE